MACDMCICGRDSYKIMDINLYDYHGGAESDGGEGAILDYAVVRTMNVDVRLAVEWVVKNI